MACLLAVLAFVMGAAVGGRWAAGRSVHRGHLLAVAAAQAGIVLAACLIATIAGLHGSALRLTMIEGLASSSRI